MSFSNFQHKLNQPNREYECDTGLYYFRARYYDPEMGRFLTKDPIGLAGGDTNLYRYCGNDPVNCVDPRGTDSIYISAGGAIGTRYQNTAGVTEAYSGVIVGYENGSIYAGGISGAGMGTNIAGITAGVGPSIGYIWGSVDSASGRGSSDTLVLGPVGFSVLRDVAQSPIGFSVGLGGEGMGAAAYSTDTFTNINTFDYNTGTGEFSGTCR